VVSGYWLLVVSYPQSGQGSAVSRVAESQQSTIGYLLPLTNNK